MTFALNIKVGFSLTNAIICELNIAIKSRSKASSYEKKLNNLGKAQKSTVKDNLNLKFIKHSVHNYSSYIFSEQEKIALSFGLEQHIPNRSCKNSIYTEFEEFYQRIFRNIRHLPQDDINRIKTKMRSTCEKYSRINVPYKYRKIVNDLSRNKDIVIMKQDKGRGVVVMNRGKYFDKCLAILNTEQFVQLQKDPTSSLEREVQCTLRKIKQKLPTDVYAKLYPTGSSPGKFYGTAKVHKLAINDTIEELPLPLL